MTTASAIWAVSRQRTIYETNSSIQINDPYEVTRQHTDGMVLVLRSGDTEQRAAERAADQLRRVDVRIFGAVLNEVASATVEESYYMQYSFTDAGK